MISKFCHLLLTLLVALAAPAVYADCESQALQSAIQRLMHSVPYWNESAPSSLHYIPTDEPPLTLEGIELKYIPLMETEPAGTCPKCLGLHMGTLLAPFVPEIRALHRMYDPSSEFPDGKTVLIYVRGNLVGVVKNAGNRSLLALRSVQNANGELVLVRGAVYEIRKELGGLVRRAGSGGKLFARLDLDHLVVNSKAWMMSEQPYGAEEPIVRELEKLAGYEQHPSAYRSLVQSHIAVMKYLSSKIREVRLRLEANSLR